MLPFLLVLAFQLARLTDGRFLTDVELEKEVCNSQVFGRISRVSVVAPPAHPVDIITIPDPASKFEVTCIRVFESGPELLPSQRDLCKEPPTLSICTAPADIAPSGTERVWTCQDISHYNSRPRRSTVLGAFNDPEVFYKITWMPVNMGPACFPRDLTTQFVGTSIRPARPNLAANIVFIIIACLVGVLALFFTSYQLRKQLSKFWQREMVAARRLPDEVRAHNSTEGNDPYGDEGHRHTDSVDYDENSVTVPRGKQRTVIEGVTITAHPMPKKWYERYDYREHPRGDASPTSPPKPIKFSIPRESINLTKTETAPLPSRSPMRDFYGEVGDADDGDNGWVRMCSDCRIVIDARAPRFCDLTGLRHF